MSLPPFEDLYPHSDAYLELPPLRIPAGWTIGWNTLRTGMAESRDGIGGASLFTATHRERRFNIDITFRPEFDPDGAFHLEVTYQPWARSEQGRRRKDVPFAFDIDAQIVHAFGTRSWPALIAALEHWIARCTVWTIEAG
jgi:hypothetical protein